MYRRVDSVCEADLHIGQHSFSFFQKKNQSKFYDVCKKDDGLLLSKYHQGNFERSYPSTEFV